MPEILLPLIAFLFPLAYSPGPGNLFFAANGARFGLRATLPANLGYHLATFAVTLAIGLGFAVLGEGMPGLLMAMKWAGSAYVLYLAWTFLRAADAGTGPEARPASFGTGVILLVLNPKAYLIIALMFTQFLTLDRTGQFQTIFWIASIFTVNNLLAFLVWTMAGDRLAARLRQGGQARRLNLIFAATLSPWHYG